MEEDRKPEQEKEEWMKTKWEKIKEWADFEESESFVYNSQEQESPGIKPISFDTTTLGLPLKLKKGGE